MVRQKKSTSHALFAGGMKPMRVFLDGTCGFFPEVESRGEPRRRSGGPSKREGGERRNHRVGEWVPSEKEDDGNGRGRVHTPMSEADRFRPPLARVMGHPRPLPAPRTPSTSPSTRSTAAPRHERRRHGPRAEWQPLAAELRALMGSGLSLAAAGGRIGVDADRAREILAEWSAVRLP